MANFSMHAGRVATTVKGAPYGADEPVVDAAKAEVALERSLTVARGPIGDIACGGAGVVAANAGDRSVSVLDPATLELLGTVALDGEPTLVAVSDDRAYVGTAADSHDGVAVVDLDSRTVVKTYPVEYGVTALAVAADGKRVYAGRAVADRVDVTVIDVTAERVGTIELGRGPAANVDALQVDPAGKRLYAAVTDANGSRLIVVDTETSRVARVVPVGSPIRDIALAGGAAYVLTSDRVAGGAVHVIDLATMRLTDRVAIGGAPTQLVTGADQTRAYVVDYDRVAVLCTLSLGVIDSVTVDARPSCVTTGADGAHLYVADYSGAVSEFAVDSTIEVLYSQFLATDPIPASVPRALHVPRTLQPVTA